MSSISAGTTTGTGLVHASDTTGDLILKTGASATTAMTISGTDQLITIPNGMSGVPHVRQTQLYGAVDSSGYNNTLSAGAALNFNVAAATTNAVFTYSQGLANRISALAADASNQGSLAASNTNYIYNDYATASTVTWASGLVPPQYGYAFDKTQNAILNFEGTNGATTTTDDFGNTWTLTTDTISTGQFKFGASSLLCTAAGYCRNTTITSFGSGSWELSLWFRHTTVGATQYLVAAWSGSGVGLTLRVSNLDKLTLALSSDGTTNNILAATSGATNIAISTWHRARVVFDALAGTYRAYLSINGAAETQEVTVSSTARLCAFTDFRIGNDTGGATGMIGNIDAFSLWRAATSTATATPSASAPTITDQKVHWFDIPSMTMREVTAASASAGTNPTFTSRNRVFVGEQDTNGSTVTATRNYALRGQYTSALIAMPGVSTATSVNHNIGTNLVKSRVRLVNQIAEAGFSPGDIVENWGTYNGTLVYPPQVFTSSLAMSTVRLSNLDIFSNKTTGASTNGTPANWKYQFIATRDF